jgi:hypothetical protein
MISQQIYSILCWDQRTCPHFKGVYPSDMLPDKFSLPAAFVVNTDESTQEGTHWVAYHFDKRGNVDYFDPYGLPPVNDNLRSFFRCVGAGGVRRYNAVQLQGDMSESCGYYCILFLTARAQGKTMSQFVNKFERPEQIYDAAVESYVKSVYSKVPLQELQFNQRCRCRQSL